jgi:LysB family phage lysis regulatory protein
MKHTIIVILTGLLTTTIIYWQHTTNKKLTTNLAITQRALNEKKALINTLNQQQNKLTQAQQALTKMLQNNKTKLINQLQTLQELKNENQTYRDWANNPLPPTVISLQQRPTITSSEHYQTYLRHRQPLPTKSNNTHHQ